MKNLSLIAFSFFLITSINCQCKKGCIVCREDNVCSKCAPGYTLPNCDQIKTNYCSSVLDENVTVVPTQNQDILNSACKKCNSGFYIDSSGTTTNGVQPVSCTICPVPNCAVCSPSTPKTCTQCYSGFFPKDGTCTTKCSVDGCDSCRSNADACDVCLPGWRKTLTGRCEKCTIDKCQNCELDKAVCSECLNDYVLEGEKCELCVYGCKKCFGRNKCLECDENFNFWMDKTQKCNLKSKLIKMSLMMFAMIFLVF